MFLSVVHEMLFDCFNAIRTRVSLSKLSILSSEIKPNAPAWDRFVFAIGLKFEYMNVLFILWFQEVIKFFFFID